MEETFIKLYRGLLNWEWYNNSQMVHLFIHLLLKANHSEKDWKGIKIKRGQLVCGRAKLSKETGISEQSIRSCLLHLKSTNEITITPTNKYSVITVCNYDEYQQSQPATKPTKSHQSTSNQPQLKNNKNNNKTVFRDSPLFDPIVFKSALGGWSKDKLRYYYDSVLEWSDRKPKELRGDWSLTVKKWASRDEKEGKLKFKPDQVSSQPEVDADDFYDRRTKNA